MGVLALSHVHVIIPARYGSTRFPGKLLELLGDRSIIQHVCMQVAACAAQGVHVATDDPRIAEHATAVGANVVMTGDCLTGSDRVAEAARCLQLAHDDVVVNVQGDEPLIPPTMVDQLAAHLLQHPHIPAATCRAPLTHTHELHNPHVVKVVVNHQGHALYFSRAAIPCVRDDVCTQALASQPMHWRHVGLYAYRVHALQALTQLAPPVMEQLELLEQLRMLYHGWILPVLEVSQAPQDINTPEDLAQARAIWPKQNSFLPEGHHLSSIQPRAANLNMP